MRLSFLFVLLFVAQIGCAQKKSVTYTDLYKAYDQYRELSIKDRRFKHVDITRLLDQLPPAFKVQKLGESIEGRSINSVTIGRGPVKVLLWSQMHGDEPTATMALMDIFRFLSADDDYNRFREMLLDRLTLVFVPMLNPDGAERFTRRNALGIDLNRDALRLQTPEAKILKDIRDQLDADWGFNLHDQNRYYSAGSNPSTASVSFLAPAYNYEKDINQKRGEAMKLIVGMNRILQEYIPNHVGRYNDDFEPRAFGDNIQKWGTRTILIESGGLKDDPEKQYLRKLHFVILLSSFDAIAKGWFNSYSTKDYFKIPFNRGGRFMDLILREVEVERNGNWYTVDIGMRNREIDIQQAKDFYRRSAISDIGDLSVYHAYQDVRMKGYRVYEGKIAERAYSSWNALAQVDPIDLLKQGVTHLEVEGNVPLAQADELPFVFLKPGESSGFSIQLGQNPAMILQKGSRIEAVVVNGRFFDLQKDQEKIRKSWNTLFH